MIIIEACVFIFFVDSFGDRLESAIFFLGVQNIVGSRWLLGFIILVSFAVDELLNIILSFGFFHNGCFDLLWCFCSIWSLLQIFGILEIFIYLHYTLNLFGLQILHLLQLIAIFGIPFGLIPIFDRLFFNSQLFLILQFPDLKVKLLHSLFK